MVVVELLSFAVIVVLLQVNDGLVPVVKELRTYHNKVHILRLCRPQKNASLLSFAEVLKLISFKETLAIPKAIDKNIAASVTANNNTKPLFFLILFSS